MYCIDRQSILYNVETLLRMMQIESFKVFHSNSVFPSNQFRLSVEPIAGSLALRAVDLDSQGSDQTWTTARVMKRTCPTDLEITRRRLILRQ